VRPSLHDAVFALCAYECAAIATRKLPTLSALSRKHRWMAPMMIGGLAVHLFRNAKEIVEEGLQDEAAD
jgi:hypothetical protein